MDSNDEIRRKKLLKYVEKDAEICKKGCPMYCRSRWNKGGPKFCDAKRIEEAMDGLHLEELHAMAIKMMWAKTSYCREGVYDFALAAQRRIIINKLEGT